MVTSNKLREYEIVWNGNMCRPPAVDATLRVGSAAENDDTTRSENRVYGDGQQNVRGSSLVVGLFRIPAARVLDIN